VFEFGFGFQLEVGCLKVGSGYFELLNSEKCGVEKRVGGAGGSGSFNAFAQAKMVFSRVRTLGREKLLGLRVPKMLWSIAG